MRPHPDDPAPSPIGNSIPDTIDGAARIRRPAIRQSFLRNRAASREIPRGSEAFVEVDWQVALDLVARELDRVIRTHGNRAIYGGSYGWSSAGRFHHAQSQIHRFLKQCGGYTDSVNTYSTAAAEVILPHVIGDASLFWNEQSTWPEIAANTDLFVAFGGIPIKNTQVNVGGVSRHDVGDWLRHCAEAGVAFVNVSPMRSDAIDAIAADWLPLRPNTDTAVMLGLAHTLVAEDLHDKAFLATHCVGFDRFCDYLTGRSDGVAKDASWAARISEIPADEIRALARRMARGRTIVSVNWAIQRADHGEQPYWMAVTLAAMLGQIGLPGGGFGTGYGGVARIGSPARKFFGPTLPQGRNLVPDYIPVARIADALLHPGRTIDYDGKRITYPELRLIYWAGGNPFHHHQDINRLLRAWQRPETIVVHEPYWNALARHADVVLPCTTPLERNDVGTATRDSRIVAMHRVVPPVGEARNDYDIFSDLAERLGFRGRFTEGRDEMAWLRHLYDGCRSANAAAGLALPDFDEFWAAGLCDYDVPQTRPPFLGAFRDAPDRHPLPTPSGRIELFSERIAGFGYDDCPGHATWIEPDEWLGAPASVRHPLHLLSNQPRNKLHSQYDHGSNSLKDKIQGREPIALHPDDAAARGIRDGDVVRVFNDRGQCLAGAVVTDTIRRGVVQMSTGAWYDPLEPGRPGTLDVHGNANVLTRDRGTSRLAQGPSAQTALVEVELYTDPLPPIRAFAPPDLREGS